MLSFFRRHVREPDVAFDLTAETFACALEATPRYEPRPEPARGWLYGIAWNKLYEARRRGQADDAARRALGMAPIEIDDDGLRSQGLDERSYDEIAARLGCSASVVRQRVSGGIRSMRTRVEGAADE
ncbi:MAG: RNA polymerase sigma factor [Solirubrobacteraceae bacterium]